MRQVFKSELVLILLGVIVSFGHCQQNSGPQDSGRQKSKETGQLDKLLTNGEFSAAIQLANRETNSAEKDRMLAAIAQSQQKHRLGAQSIRSIARIADDLLRNRTLRQVRQVGGGPVGLAPGGFGNVAGPGGPANAAGGAAIADFDPLIELIQNTIDPQSWLDTNGGPGTINEFRSGVSVDAGGLLRKVEYSKNNGLLNGIRSDSRRRSINTDVFRESELRKISLTRLEKECQLLAAAGKPPTLAMQRLAGLYEIKYLLVYPETGDIVIAGPAGDWKTDVEGTAVHVKSNRPLFRLDDLVVVLRNAVEFDGKFGCSIDPRQANLQETQEFLATSKLKGKPWSEGIRKALGLQDIRVDGIDPQSVVARVIVEADYRMKLVAMDLEKGVPGVESVLSRVQLDRNGRVPPMDVMRLEFVLDYENVSVTDSRDAYQLNGRGVKVVSEKELLSQKGERIHTGKSEGLASEFAKGFTTHFQKMANQYPIYAQLKNVFDLAMVANLIRLESIDTKCKWSMSYFGSDGKNELVYQPLKGRVPREVKTVMNYREIIERKNGRRVRTHPVVGVSGGVTVDASRLLKSDNAIVQDTYGRLKLDRKTAKPDSDHWWWD